MYNDQTKRKKNCNMFCIPKYTIANDNKCLNLSLSSVCIPIPFALQQGTESTLNLSIKYYSSVYGYITGTNYEETRTKLYKMHGACKKKSFFLELGKKAMIINERPRLH